MTPTRVLIQEHEIIEHALAVLEGARQLLVSGEGVPIGTLAQVLDFFQSFVLGCHQAKEEQVLFPRLADKPIARLMHEHGRERELLGEMAETLPELRRSVPARLRFSHSATAYRQLVRHHMAEENVLLLCVEGGFLTPQESQDVLHAFSGYENAQMDSLSSWVAGLEARACGM